MIEFKNVSKSYDNKRSFAVSKVSLTVAQGETLVILGSSGSGKSTLLKMVNLLITPTSGSIYVKQKNQQDYVLTELRQQMGYVFQENGLFEHMTVMDNIVVSLRVQKVATALRRQRADTLMRLVNLDPEKYRQRYPYQLSGGEQQRVGVARALANDPDYLLMDEPFGALDPVTRDELQKQFKSIIKNTQKTVIFVTHDVFEALRLADRIAVMHEGKLLQVADTQAIVKQPANQFVHQLFNKPFEQLKKYHD